LNDTDPREDEEARASPTAAVVKAVLRTAVGVSVFAFLLVRSDISAMGRALADADPLPIALANVLMVALLVVSALRWRVLLEGVGVHLGIGPATRLTMVGAFFNAFLPTGVGGDVYKAVRLKRSGVGLSLGLASVLLDRIAGVVCLAAIGLVACGARLLVGDTGPVVVVAAVTALGVLVVAALVLTFGERLVGSGTATWFGVRPKLRRILGAIVRGSRNRRALRWGILAGFGAQVLGLAAHLSLAAALDLDVPVAVMATGLLVATLAATVPVTINGLGIREGVWVWVLGAYGVAAGDALAFAILVLAMSLASSAIGGIVYAISGGDVVATTTRAEA
jgi:glycosyltransferase 2 family protein